MTLWELLHLERVYADYSDIAVFMYFYTENKRPPITLDPELACFASILMRCWPSDPTGRPTMQQVIDEIKSSLDESHMLHAVELD